MDPWYLIYLCCSFVLMVKLSKLPHHMGKEFEMFSYETPIKHPYLAIYNVGNDYLHYNYFNKDIRVGNEACLLHQPQCWVDDSN